MQKDSSWTLPWIKIQLPCIFQDLLSKEWVHFFLVDVGVIDGYKESIRFLLELVMRPEGIIESEVMLFFIFTSDLMYDGGVISHLDTGGTTKKGLPLIKRTNSDGNFDTHILYVSVYNFIDNNKSKYKKSTIKNLRILYLS